LITDLVQIRRLGEKKRGENLKFRRFLKTHGYNELRLRRIGQAIEEQIDCTACANCCKVASVPLRKRDIEKLAKFFRTSVGKFKAEYVTEDEFSDTVLRRTGGGCVFLSGNQCTVYEARPSNCVNFPHIVRGEGPISTRMWQFVDRASYCPIVYNALEAFKDETGFDG
jgi:Fe-S-cluster containining protein